MPKLKLPTGGLNKTTIDKRIEDDPRFDQRTGMRIGNPRLIEHMGLLMTPMQKKACREVVGRTMEVGRDRRGAPITMRLPGEYGRRIDVAKGHRFVVLERDTGGSVEVTAINERGEYSHRDADLKAERASGRRRSPLTWGQRRVRAMAGARRANHERQGRLQEKRDERARERERRMAA